MGGGNVCSASRAVTQFRLPINLSGSPRQSHWVVGGLGGAATIDKPCQKNNVVRMMSLAVGGLLAPPRSPHPPTTRTLPHSASADRDECCRHLSPTTRLVTEGPNGGPHPSAPLALLTPFLPVFRWTIDLIWTVAAFPPESFCKRYNCKLSASFNRMV